MREPAAIAQQRDARRATFAVALFFIGGPVDPERLRDRRHHHRAHV